MSTLIDMMNELDRLICYSDYSDASKDSFRDIHCFFSTADNIRQVLSAYIEGDITEEEYSELLVKAVAKVKYKEKTVAELIHD